MIDSKQALIAELKRQHDELKKLGFASFDRNAGRARALRHALGYLECASLSLARTALNDLLRFEAARDGEYVRGSQEKLREIIKQIEAVEEISRAAAKTKARSH